MIYSAENKVFSRGLRGIVSLKSKLKQMHLEGEVSKQCFH